MKRQLSTFTMSLGLSTLGLLALFAGKSVVFADGPLTTNNETNAPVVHHKEWTPPENVVFTSAPVAVLANQASSGTDYVTFKTNNVGASSSKYDSKGEVTRMVWSAESKVVRGSPDDIAPTGAQRNSVSPNTTSATCSQKYTAYGQFGQKIWDYQATCTMRKLYPRR